MPFITCESKNKEEHLYLIPDVSGNPYSMQKILGRFESTIHLWKDSRISDSDGPKNLFEVASEIAEAIQQKQAERKESKNINIAGYSMGGVVAALVAIQLKKVNKNVSLCIIDSPSPLYSQKYLVRGNVEATLNLISIIKYIAILAGLDQIDISISEAQIKTWSGLKIAEQLQAIYVHYFSSQDNLASIDSAYISAFHRYYQIITSNLLSLLECKIESAESIADRMLVLMTESTCKEYKSSSDGGWAPFCNLIQINKLPGNHQSIFSEGIASLSALLSSFISNKKPENLNKEESKAKGLEGDETEGADAKPRWSLHLFTYLQKQAVVKMETEDQSAPSVGAPGKS